LECFFAAIEKQLARKIFVILLKNIVQLSLIFIIELLLDKAVEELDKSAQVK